ncbi:tetratricopeptide repeat protein [Oleidesulfovibrio sp.]|uniref:tetratricopeptide repeat protein n=1 Tax=Oleidesulfovibrio sp. TaxID=2909707 RepID=UPI003A86A8C7
MVFNRSGKAATLPADISAKHRAFRCDVFSLETFCSRCRLSECLGGVSASLALGLMLCLAPAAGHAAKAAASTAPAGVEQPESNSAVVTKLEAMHKGARWEAILKETGGVKPSLTLPSSGPEIVRYRAEALMALGREGEALTLIGRGLAIDPENARLLTLRGDAQLALGYPQRAADDYIAALKSDEKEWRAVHGMALLARTAGDLPATLEWYDKLILMQPDNAMLRMERALMEHEAGLVARAQRDMEVVTMLAPDNPDVWNNRGMMYLAQGEAVKAMQDFDKALDLQPDHAGALLNRGNLWRERMDLQHSLTDLSKGVKLHPRHVKMRVARMYTNMALGRYADAKADLEAAYDLNSLDVYLLNEFSWFLATVPEDSLRDGARAVRYVREALDLSPVPVASYFDTLGAAYAETGDFKMAVEAQERALLMAMDRGYPETILNEWRGRLDLYRQKLPYRSGN